MSNLIVEVEQGKLQGKACGKFIAFKSIPYAKPPIGQLRFSVPLPPEPWTGVRDATNTCDICAQFDYETNSIVGSEDCLYLNVYTPKINPTNLMPVMVFFHGGGFVFGNGTDDSVHGPDYLIEKDVVTVSLNYRLGILGFLCLDLKEAPGNMGLRDQVQALKWVQKNIKQFGGDPGNVTLLGISAGAASIEYLMLSPMAKGLFHKAIAQSGSSLLPWAQNDKIKELTMKIPAEKGKQVNSDEELLQYLKEMTTNNLVLASMAVMEKQKHQGGLFFGFVPTIEKPKDWDPFLDKCTYHLLSQGEFAKVPYITGYCTREGLIMASLTRQPELKKLVNEKNFEMYLYEFFGIDSSKVKDVSSKLKEVYLSENVSDEIDAFAIDFFSDIDFIGGIYTAAYWIAKHNPSVYMYEFNYDGNLNYVKKKFRIDRKGACHGDDGGYIIKSQFLLAENLSATDVIVKERMQRMWTNFAKNGVPTMDTGDIISTKWEPVGDKMSYLLINENLTMKNNPYPVRTQLFKELYETYYSKKY